MPTGRVRPLGLLLLYVLLVGISSSAIWSVEHYVNQDGIAHVYNAYLMDLLLAGGHPIQQTLELNPHLMPNVTGHWILAFLLPLTGPEIATKLMVTFLFAAYVAAAGWLRQQVQGSNGVAFALLFGAAIAFNWPWFLGFYNFSLSVACFAFTLGLWWRWRQQMNLWRSICLFLLLMFTFLSHLIGFAVLGFSITFLAIMEWKRSSRRSLIWTGATLAATAPFLLYILSLSRSEDPVSPHWNFLSDPLSIKSWIIHWAASDPFPLISRRAFPFVEARSDLFAIFTPIIWIGLAVVIGVAATLLVNRLSGDRLRYNSWLLLAGVLGMIWVLAPDDFGSEHGGLLRERLLVMAAATVIPVFRFGDSRILRGFAIGSLAIVVMIQTLVLWDYSPRADRFAKQVLSVSEHVGNNDSVASVITITEELPFKAMPMVNLTPYIGLGKEGLVWDNYELQYYFFPVITRSIDDREFVQQLRSANSIEYYKEDEPRASLSKLEQVLEKGHSRIDVLLVWNEQPELAPIRRRWFESEPYYHAGDIALYRHLAPNADQ